MWSGWTRWWRRTPADAIVGRQTPVPPVRRRPRSRGAMLVLAVLLMPVMIGPAAFSVEWGRVMLVKLELEKAADAAARYAVTSVRQNRAACLTKAREVAAQNTADGQPLTVLNADFIYGRWDAVTKQLTPFGSTGMSSAAPDAVSVTLRRTVPLTFGGLSADAPKQVEVTATAVARRPGILLIVSNPLNPFTRDLWMRDTLAAAGWAVQMKSTNEVVAADCYARAGVIVSSSADPSILGDRLRDVPEPVMILRSGHLPNFGLTGPVQGVDFGDIDNQSQVHVVSSTLGYPVGADVTTTSTPGRYYWGVPASGAIPLTSIVGNPGLSTIFWHQTGSTMVGGYAPGRRMVLPWHNIEHVESNGTAMFLNLVRFTIDHPPTKTVSVR